MAAEVETYSLLVRFEIEADLKLDADLSGQAVPIRQAREPSKGEMTVKLTPSDSLRSTNVEIRWEFDDFFEREPANNIEAQAGRIQDGCPWFRIPTPNSDPSDSRQYVCTDEMFNAAKLYIARVCIATRSPYFWNAMRRSNLTSLKAYMSVRVDGIETRMVSGVASAGTAIRSTELAIERALRLGQEKFPPYAAFLLTADNRFLNTEIPAAIVHLAQALEVAAYSFLKKLAPDSVETYNFSVLSFFGARENSQIRLLGLEPLDNEIFIALSELWGARHEWIHVGNPLIRLYDPEQKKIPRVYGTRPMLSGDYYSFRAAVSKALTWMDEVPIE